MEFLLVNRTGAGFVMFDDTNTDLTEEFLLRGIFIGVGVKFDKRVCIHNRVTIEDYAKIGESSILHTGCKIGSFSQIGAQVEIGERAIIGGHRKPSTTFDHIVPPNIPDHSKIVDDATVSFCLFVKGSKHPLTYAGNNFLKIGCMVKSFDYWKTRYEMVGATEFYTEVQIAEYKTYIDLFISLYSQNTNWNEVNI